MSGGGLRAALGPAEERATQGNMPVAVPPGGAALVLEGVVDAFMAGADGAAPWHVAALAAGEVALAPGDGGPALVLRGEGPARVAVAPGGGARLDAADDARAAVQAWRSRLRARDAERAAAPDPAATMARRLALDGEAERVATADLRAALEGRERPSRPAGVAPVATALLDVAEAAGAPADPARLAALARSGAAPDDPARLAAALRVPVRRVGLEGRWWTEEGLPMLGARDDGSPVALIPERKGYVLADPAAPGRAPVTPEVAAGLQGAALAAYPRLPDRPVRLRDLVRMGGGRRTRRDLVSLAAGAVALAVLAAAVPLATGYVAGTIVPEADRGALPGLIALLVALALGAFLATVLQGVAMLRLSTRLDLRMTAATWDRVLRLSPAFFRRYPAGELGRRVLALDELRTLVTGATVAASVAALVGLSSLVLMVLYEPLLGLAALAVTAVAVGLAAWFMRRQQADERVAVTERNRLSGLLLAMLGGIAKIRVAGAERRAHAAWATGYSRQALAERRAGLRAAQVATLAATLPGAATLAVVLVAASGGNDVPAGTMVGFATALGQLVAVAGATLPVAATLMRARPLYESARPVLDAVPETDPDAADPGTVRGEIELVQVSFRYSEDAPPALDRVSLRIEPGQMVAVVGPSGSGKSTLVRLLLGFDRPDSGAVLIDGHPLDGLDLAAVRRQIGTVIQDARLSSGSVFTNIAGAAPIGEDEVWEAARLVGLADDVRAMPMGLQTLVPEGGAGFSGGQAQRILLARALVRRPRVVVLDEATAYLDNVTQALVARSLGELGITRVVIAHRLSTIRAADRVFVLDGGRLVEQGGVDELMAAGGPFARLARRQLAE